MGSARTFSALCCLFLLGAALLFRPLSACAADQSKNEGKAVDKVSVQLHWLHQFEFAGFYVAKHKGFYAEQGIDVDIREFSEARESVTEEVLSGRADFGVGYSSLIHDYLTGKPVVALAALLQESPLALITREDGDIQTLEDLVGRRVMIGGDAINAVPVMALLFSQGLSRKDIEIVPHSHNIEDLIAGRTDAMTAYVSNEPFQMQAQDQRVRIFSPSDVGLSFYGNLLFTSSEQAQSDPEIVRAFMDATLKGWEAAFADIEGTIDLIKSNYDTQAKSREALRFEAEALKRLAYRDGLPLGHIGLEKLGKASDAYRLMGIKLAERDLEKFVWHLQDWERFRQIGLTASEIAFLDRTLIRAATTTNWAPFAFVDPESDLPSGIGLEFWQEIVSRGGLKSSIRSFDSFPNELQSLKTRDVDVIYSVGETPERREYALFSEPYASFPLVIATSKDENFIADVGQLEGKTIAVGRNFTAHKMMAAAYPNLSYLLVGNVREGLEAVSSGKAFGFVDIMPVLSHALNDYGFTNLKISGEMDLVFDLRIMIRKDYPELLSIVNKIIPGIPVHRRLEILNRWSNVTYEQKLRIEAYLPEISLASLLIVMLLLWMYQAKAQAQRANRAKSEFLALMSHDLRTPLNAIMGFTDMIRHETFGPIGHDRYRGYLDDIHSSGTLLVNLINDILDLSRVEAGKYVLAEEVVDVRAICTSVISQCGVIAASGDIRLHLDSDDELPMLRGDERVLTQMLNNLVSNAIKFSERETIVTLSANVAQNDEITLKIQDQGIGMTESEIEHVMKPFERVDRYEVRRQEGTGLGLYLCQSFMKLFGGRMEISSEPDAGTTVKLVFPSNRTVQR